MTAPKAAELEVEYVLDDGTWTLDITLGKTKMLIETSLDEPDSLPTLVGSLNQILDAAWGAVEDEIGQRSS